jgi:glucose 1-dehydrogenase
MRFSDKVCMVTGGGSGIGKATCERFASEGASVVIADIDPEHLSATTSTITKQGGKALPIRVDVSYLEQIRACVVSAVQEFSRIDVLVNNAAIMTFDPVEKLSDEDWQHVLTVNLTAVFRFCKYVLPHMPVGSSIINISSVHVHETEAGVAPYAASKGGMEAFSRVLALECANKKIRVNCVEPGAVDTPMLWNNPAVKSGTEKVQGAVGKPEDLAAVICFLASSEARFINGASVPVDGARLDIL